MSTAKYSVQDLFGSDDEEEQNVGEQTTAVEEEDDDEQEIEISASTSFPQTKPLPRKAKLHFMKLINVLGFETKPFVPDKFKFEDDDKPEKEFYPDGTPKLKVHHDNIIRWRFARDEDGHLVRESNARFVRWSDGSLQLFVGKEVFDVKEQNIVQQNFHLYTRHQRLMRCQGILTDKLILFPSTVFSKSHKKLAMTIAETQKIKKSKMNLALGGDKDPEEQKKINEELERRKNSKQQRERRKRGSGGGYSSRGVTDDFLEYDEDENDETSFSLADIKNSRSKRKSSSESEQRIKSAKYDNSYTKRAKSPQEEYNDDLFDEEEEEAQFSDDDGSESEGEGEGGEEVGGDDDDNEDNEKQEVKKQDDSSNRPTRRVILNESDEE